MTESRRKTNLEAFGFPLGPTFPKVVGPFNVFDARVFASQPILDLDALNASRASIASRSRRPNIRYTARAIDRDAGERQRLRRRRWPRRRAEAVKAQLDVAWRRFISRRSICGRTAWSQESMWCAPRCRSASSGNARHRDRERCRKSERCGSRASSGRSGQQIALVDDLPQMSVRPMTVEARAERSLRKREGVFSLLLKTRTPPNRGATPRQPRACRRCG